VAATIRDGRNSMPAFSTLLTPAQIRDVAAFVAERIARPAP
jgi:mono/diheme cytochrome c family protein